MKSQPKNHAKYSTGAKARHSIDRKSLSPAGYAKGQKKPKVVDPKATPVMKQY